MADDNDLFNIFGEIKVHLGGIFNRLGESLDWQKRAKKYDVPISRVEPWSLVMPTSGLGFAGLSGPNQGRLWNIRSITVSGVDPSVAISGRLDVYVTGSNLSRAQSLSDIGSMDWRDYTTTLPSVAFYGVGEMRVRAGEKLRLVFSGINAGTQLSGSIVVEDYEDAAYVTQLLV